MAGNHEPETQEAPPIPDGVTLPPSKGALRPDDGSVDEFGGSGYVEEAER